MRRFQRSDPAARDSPVPPRPPGNLPAALDRFIGRRTEAERVCAELALARTVTVTGPGGVGKTRLALHAAERVQDRFCSGVWLAELAPLRDGALLDHTVAEALELADCPGHSLRSTLRRHLARREALLVLDGCEHLVEECAELAADLLRRAPGLRILAVSRRPLDIPGERTLPLGTMPEEEAVELFAERAAAVLPGFDAAGAGRTAVAELCHRLEGIPLALELAAGRLRALSVEQLIQRLEDRFGLLTAGGRRGGEPRHRTLRTAVGWSHELCTPQERLLWARLSVFAGDFGLEAAEYLCAGGDLPADRVLPVLAELVAQSVVCRQEREGPGGQVRYRMLESVREYGAGWLEQLADTERLRRRHRDWYLGLGTWCELDWFGPRQAEIAARTEQELPNLRLALEYSLECPEDVHVGQYLAATLWFCWIGCGRLAEGRVWLERALALEGDQPEARAKALWVAGLAAVLRGDAVDALGLLHECLELAESHEDASAAAYATQMLGCLAVTDDDPARARALLGEALERFRRLGELNTLVIMAQVQLAMAHLFDGDAEGALAVGEEAREIAADSGERWALSYALYVLARAHAQRGDADRARTLSVECLAVKREFRDVLGMTLALEQLAPLTVAEEPERAAEMLGAALSGWRALGVRRYGPEARVREGDRCRTRAVEAVGTEAYEAAHRRGGRLGPVAVAAREVGERPGDPAATRPAARGAGLTARGPAGVLPERGAVEARQPACPPPPAGADGGQAG